MVSSKHKRTLAAIFATPVRASIHWHDIETLNAALGGTVSEGAGSRVVLELSGKVAVFHRPHPRPETDKGAVVAVRKFLIEAGISP
ncbi:MAG: type II toxin-antitoxin system HicA family toxin [Gemmobacter sp.]